jgi:hypothetical protein
MKELGRLFVRQLMSIRRRILPSTFISNEDFLAKTCADTAGKKNFQICLEIGGLLGARDD